MAIDAAQLKDAKSRTIVATGSAAECLEYLRKQAPDGDYILIRIVPNGKVKTPYTKTNGEITYTE